MLVDNKGGEREKWVLMVEIVDLIRDREVCILFFVRLIVRLFSIVLGLLFVCVIF